MDELKQWVINYVKHRDLTFKRIQNIVDNGGSLVIHFKDKKQYYDIKEELDEKIFSLPKDIEFKTVACLNIEKNFNFLIKNWQKLSQIKNLTIIFVNLKGNDKWLITPHTHNMIADPASLESGLKTMFNTANGKIEDIKIPKKKPKLFDDDVATEDDSEET